jgi:hypothetical protein
VSHTYVFSLPVVLAAMWWGRKGISIAVALGVYIMFSAYLFLNRAPGAEDFTLTAILMILAFVVSLLSEGLDRVERAYTSRVNEEIKSPPPRRESFGRNLKAESLKG